MKKRISMILLNPFTHDARVDREAKSLVESGYEVLVYAMYRAPLPRHEIRNGYEICRIDVSSVGFGDFNISPALKYLAFIRKLWKISKNRPADYYHSHDANSLLATYPLVKRDRAQWVYDAHELESGRSFSSGRLNKLYYRIWPIPERVFIRRVDSVMCVNGSIADILAKTYEIERPAIVRNVPRHAPISKTELLRSDLQLTSSDFIILYQGLLAKNRGIDATIKAIQLLGDRYHLVLLGDGHHQAALANIARKLGVENRVHFLGYVPPSRLLSYTSSADVGTSLIEDSSLSYYYSLPNKFFEYIMAGVPVVASDFPEMGKIIREFDIGELVHDPSSPQAVASAIERILSTPSRYQEMVHNTHQAANKLNWENEQKQLVKVYRNLSERQESDFS